MCVVCFGEVEAYVFAFVVETACYEAWCDAGGMLREVGCVEGGGRGGSDCAEGEG